MASHHGHFTLGYFQNEKSKVGTLGWGVPTTDDASGLGNAPGGSRMYVIHVRTFVQRLQNAEQILCQECILKGVGFNQAG